LLRPSSIYFFILALLAGVPLGAAGIVNGDFETGSLAPWNVGISTGAYVSVSPTVALVTGGTAPNTNGQLSQLYGGTYSAALYSGVGDTGHLDIASISQPVAVTAALTNLQFYCAAVLNGAHAGTPNEDAYFEITVLDSSSNVLQYTRFFYDNSPVPLVDDGVYGWKHMPWTPILIDLSAYVGQTVTIRFSVQDCNQGGHDCYAYVDGFSLVPTPSITVTPSPYFTNTPVFSPTLTPSFSMSSTYSSSPTPTASPTATPSYTASPTRTATLTASPTATVTVTCTNSPTPSITCTHSITPTFSITPTHSPTGTITQTFTASPTVIAQNQDVTARTAYPIPFRDSVTVVLVAKLDGYVDLVVYNVAGEPVYRERTWHGKGESTWTWDGSNNAGARLATGVYILRVRGEDASGPPGFLTMAIGR
jgi:hypothetical protein